MYPFLDILLTVAHLTVIGMNLLGWIWQKTRKLHLVCVLLTACSWVILGIWYGWGYCFLTDWQWEIKRTLGETDLPNSYIKYAVDQLTGWDTNPDWIDTLTALSFGIVALLSVILNIRDSRKRNKYPSAFENQNAQG